MQATVEKHNKKLNMRHFFLFSALFAVLHTLSAQVINDCNCPMRIEKQTLPVCSPLKPRIYIIWSTPAQVFNKLMLGSVEYNFTNVNLTTPCTGVLPLYDCPNLSDRVVMDVPSCYINTNVAHPTGTLTFANGLTCEYTDGRNVGSSRPCPPTCSEIDECFDDLLAYVRSQYGITDDCRVWEGPCNTDSKIYRSGAVSIGAKSPVGDAQLAVNGKIRTEQVKICQSEWCDYVFEPDYCLRPLPEVALHIAQHGYLPGCTPGSTIAAQGTISLGREIRSQQEKIEEIFLYLIQLDKQIAAEK